MNGTIGFINKLQKPDQSLLNLKNSRINYILGVFLIIGSVFLIYNAFILKYIKNYPTISGIFGIVILILVIFVFKFNKSAKVLEDEENLDNSLKGALKNKIEAEVDKIKAESQLLNKIIEIEPKLYDKQKGGIIIKNKNRNKSYKR